MKQVLAIILGLCMLTQCCLHIGIYAWFRANQAEIARTRCENRDKPELNCCGSCVLQKQLRKADDQESGAGKGKPLTRIDKTELAACVIPAGLTMPRIALPAAQPRRYAAEPGSRLSSFSPAIFHPPADRC